ncbi:MAG: 1-phosphofructokinase family hexose kinase [Gammaproteobacteria bacterium]|nr:1-phosphofructokinase family hexose kinase [Gammaproteobacteria bacterium]
MKENHNQVSVLALNPSVDISYEIPQLLAYQKVRASQTWYHPGGNGINITRGLIELGVSTNCCSIIAGESGDLLMTLLGDSLGDRHRSFRVAGETRLNTTIVQQSPPGQYEITSVGPEVPADVLAEACDCFVKVADKGIAVLSGLLPPGAPENTYRKLIERINQQGGRAVLDAYGETLQQALEAKPWLVRLNHYVLETTMKRRMDTKEQVAEVARTIQQLGVEYVCVSLGDKGAVLIDADNSYHCEAPRIHKQSTVGSGDSLLAGLIATALRQETTQQMLRFGVICGSATASHPGTELFRRDELESGATDLEVIVLDV